MSGLVDTLKFIRADRYLCFSMAASRIMVRDLLIERVSKKLNYWKSLTLSQAGTKGGGGYD